MASNETKTTFVYMSGRSSRQIPGHLSYDEALAQARRDLQASIKREEASIEQMIALLDRYDDWQVAYRDEYDDDVAVPPPAGSTPTMRGQYCTFAVDGETCSFGNGHAVRYHLVGDARYPAPLGGVA